MPRKLKPKGELLQFHATSTIAEHIEWLDAARDNYRRKAWRSVTIRTYRRKVICDGVTEELYVLVVRAKEVQ